MLFLFLSCGLFGSVVGDWLGECQNPATGVIVSFEIDIDTDDSDGFTGDADVTYTDNTGEVEETDCLVEGSHVDEFVELEFECENGDNFELDLTKDGKVMLGDCGLDAELFLERQ